MSSERNRFVVGVDYGTTYSAVAYTYLQTEHLHTEHRDIEVIKTWPSQGHRTLNIEKVPTEISFETDGNLWGYQIAPGAMRYGFFKLLLDAETGRAKYDHPLLGSAIDSGSPNTCLRLPPGKDVNDITFEYLRLLYEHIIQWLRVRVPVTFDYTPIQFVLPTPATWGHLAKDATCEAAKRAGFGSRPGDTITMISETEAVAYHCLAHSARGGPESSLREGQHILICDAGDWTVDLICYTISQTSPFFKVNEASIATRGICGSMAVDRAFLEFVESRVGAPFKKWPPRRTGRGSILMVALESAKMCFGTSSHNQTWRVTVGNVEDNIENGIEEGELTITSKEMTEIFNPIVRQIIQLVAQQVSTVGNYNGKVSTIFLVGSLGGWRYLFEKLKEWCESQPFPVDVISPIYSWSAVARGAVIHGIQNIDATQKLRSHYGVVLACPFRRAKHDEEEAYFDEFLMKIMTNDNVVWFAKKGEDVGGERRFPLSCFRIFPEWQGKVIKLDLKHCRFDDAPVSPKSDKVETVGQIKVDLSSIAESEFEVLEMTPRGRIFGAEFTIEMAVSSAEQEVTFSLIHNGVSHGNAQVEYYWS